jgi:hypothetical protein|tara:strand:- start:30 stop:275 length:246 start_codon:yes stop_codon:yes gene_type:complete
VVVLVVVKGNDGEGNDGDGDDEEEDEDEENEDGDGVENDALDCDDFSVFDFERTRPAFNSVSLMSIDMLTMINGATYLMSR